MRKITKYSVVMTKEGEGMVLYEFELNNRKYLLVDLIGKFAETRRVFERKRVKLIYTHDELIRDL